MKYSIVELAETFTGVLGDVSHALESLGIPWMLVGGLAVGGWTEPRATKDCDLAIAVPTDPTPLVAALGRAGLTARQEQFTALTEGGPLRLRTDRPDAPSIVVDLLCAGTPFEHEALSRRRPLTVLGVPLFAASPDDLVIYKLIAGRPQDLADVDRLFRFGRAPEDESYLRRWVRAWEIEDRLDRALATARRDDE